MHAAIFFSWPKFQCRFDYLLMTSLQQAKFEIGLFPTISKNLWTSRGLALKYKWNNHVKFVLFAWTPFSQLSFGSFLDAASRPICDYTTGRRGVMFDRNASSIHCANRSCNSKQWTWLNRASRYRVTRLVKFYPQDKRPTIGRRLRKAKLSEVRHEVPRRKRDKGRNKYYVTRAMWAVTYRWRKRNRIFCMLWGSEINRS